MQTKSSIIKVLLGSFIALAFLSAVHSPRLDDDSYSHFRVSVDAVSNLDARSIVTDTWNKPVTAVVYGLPGQAGLLAARLVSVLFTVLTAFLVYRVAVVMLGFENILHPLTVVAFFLCQLAVFSQAFLTMTELLAAFFLALGIHSFQARKYLLAFLSIGMMPLARVESCLITGWALSVMFIALLLRGGIARSNILRLAGYSLYGILPFAAWWLAGFLYTGNAAWQSSSYVYLRDFSWAGVLSVNALTGLPAVLSAPLMALFVVGCFRLPVLTRGSQDSSEKSQLGMILYGALIIHFLFLSLFVVYPRGSGYSDIAISALNARNYNSISPVLALFIYAGAVSLFRPQPEDGKRSYGWLIAGSFVSVVLIAGFFFFWQQFSFRPLVQMGLLRHIQQSLLLAGFVVIVFICVGFIFRKCEAADRARRIVLVVTAYCILCLPLTDPVFWYPLKFNDRKMAAQDEFGLWYKKNVTGSGLFVVQDINGMLEKYCGINEGRFAWVYPALFLKSVNDSKPGTLVVLETDAAGTPQARYPSDLLAELQTERYRLIGRSSAPKPLNALERLIQKISSRNDPVGWLVYQKVM